MIDRIGVVTKASMKWRVHADHVQQFRPIGMLRGHEIDLE